MRLIIAICAFISIACQHQSATKPPEPEAKFATASGLMSPGRQLTFVGPRAGEGYFSADGRMLTFQSERDPKNPFYQIYLLNLETGKTQRVSNGDGKTTCSWIHPQGQKVLFASTHKDKKWRTKAKEEMEFRARGERAKYAWSYDDQFDLYERDMKGTTYKALSPALGYDAEGSYSPDGKWIAFSSNRLAYSQKLSAEEIKRRDQDPSYYLDIFIMKADGSQLQRLTDEPGYDGGPFFSPDGQYLTWRRFTPDGKIAEVWTMKTDGTEKKQLTHLGAMSWAPFFHPSGDYLIFTTNLLGYDNFELFIVDRQGKHPPVRVSDIPGFDGLPVFTPDGQQVAWSHKNEKGESQIYISNWNDALARAALGLPKSEKPAPMMGIAGYDISEVKKWVEYLASEELAGRASGSPEEKIYMKKIADEFLKLGLKPMVGKQYQQKFKYVSGVSLGEGNSFKLQGLLVEPKLGFDWTPMSMSQSTTVASAPIVFAGYGIVAPATEKQPSYDSYQGLEIKGKWALVLRDLPNDITNERRFQLNTYARIQHKALVAAQAGAVGLIVINPNANDVKLVFEGGGGQARLPIIEVSSPFGQKLVANSGKSFGELKKRLDSGEIVTATLGDLKAEATTLLTPDYSEAQNVIGKIIVPGAKGTLIFGAHGDHLGHGERGNTLARDGEKGQIHYGADDNASGVAALMDLARYFATEVYAGRMKPKTNLAFAVWSGEELGILGSSHFANELGSEKVTANLNMDMIGRLRDMLMVQGVGSAKEWPEIMERLASQTPVALSLQNDPYVPSDATAFYLKKIPSLSFFTGAHTEYHSPRDRAELINYAGLKAVTDVIAKLGKELSLNPTLTYVKVEGSRKSSEGRGFRLYLGTIPDYSQEGVQGVKISGTTKASPAEKAGLVEGDIIVQLGGTPVNNIQDYVYCLQAMKANEKTSIHVMRQGRRVELEITPALRGM